MKCSVFRCSRKEEMYLYLPFQEDDTELIKTLSDDLLKLTGHLEKVLELEITEGRKLARVKAKDVLYALQDKGYYLQIPPNAVLIKDASMLHNPSDSF